ncbi:MAG: hypothetical protein R3324_16140, partial [Halobacteriales archaeon]|nr:hypothetical protein [Halobacteriales archaeon]
MSNLSLVVSEDRRDPLMRHRFSVTVEGRPPIGIAEVHGLSVAVTEAPGEDDPAPTSEDEDRKWWDLSGLVDSITEGASLTEPRSTSSPTLELHRGVTPDVPLFGWLHDWVQGTTA